MDVSNINAEFIGKILLGLFAVITGYWGWKRISETRIAKKEASEIAVAEHLAGENAEYREDQRKETENLREQVQKLRHRLNNDEHVYGLQHELHTERLKSAQIEREKLALEMEALRREHREELREREERFEFRLEERKVRELALTKQVQEFAAQVQELTRKVQELTRRLAKYEPDHNLPKSQG